MNPGTCLKLSFQEKSLNPKACTKHPTGFMSEIGLAVAMFPASTATSEGSALAL